MGAKASWSLIALAASCGFPTLPPLSSEFGLQLVAGNIGGPGDADGTGAAAAFDGPWSIEGDGAGNLYVSDNANETIRKITANGVVTTFAGTARMVGSSDATGTAARFRDPEGVAFDPDSGNLYIADASDFTIRKITQDGVVTTLAGTPGMSGSADGTGNAARFSQAEGLAVDSIGDIYVSDTDNNTIRMITPAGIVTTVAGTAGQLGNVDGIGSAARFWSPLGLAVDSSGSVYIADEGNCVLRKMTPAGVVTTFAGKAGMCSDTDGSGANAGFASLSGVAIDDAGTLYAADGATIRKVTPTAVVSTVAGKARTSGSADGTGAAARFSEARNVTADGVGNIYVTDLFNDTIRKITPTGVVTTLAGAAPVTGSANGTGAAVTFDQPLGIAVDAAGNAYVTDTGNCTLRKITPDGVVTTLAGIAGVCASVDGTGPSGIFKHPAGVAVDNDGTLYVADTENYTIRKVTSSGTVTTLAGMPGMSGIIDGNGAAAQFLRPNAVAVDAAGTVYVADDEEIRRITIAGDVTTLAGSNSPGAEDGIGEAARFGGVTGIAVDDGGSVYVADQGNDTIRKVTSAGVVTTLAGAAGLGGSDDGTGASARFAGPSAVALGGAGEIYVADQYNSTIRKVTPDGVVTTVAGNAGAAKIALGATPGFASPVALAIQGDSILVVDTNAILLLRHAAQ